MPEAIPTTQLSLAFSEGEDRLVLFASDASGKQETLLLTRRLTARLTNGIAVVLEHSNIVASMAPDEMRSDIILMEHQGALASAGEGRDPAGEAVSGQPLAGETLQLSPRLVTTVNLTTNPTNFNLVFQAAGGEPVAMVLNRLDLHRVLELLKRQAESAGWNLQIDAAWLGDDYGQLSLN